MKVVKTRLVTLSELSPQEQEEAIAAGQLPNGDYRLDLFYAAVAKRIKSQSTPTTEEVEAENFRIKTDDEVRGAQKPVPGKDTD
jgi:hypothetical protein